MSESEETLSVRSDDFCAAETSLGGVVVGETWFLWQLEFLLLERDVVRVGTTIDCSTEEASSTASLILPELSLNGEGFNKFLSFTANRLKEPLVSILLLCKKSKVVVE